MTQETILSGEEIEALMGRGAASPGEGGSSGKPRSFAFGGGASQPNTTLPALDRVNDRLAKRMREVIEPFLRAKPAVHVEPAVIRPLGDWQAEQGVFAGLSMYTMRPLKGTLTVAVPSEFVSRLVDAFYGGTGAAPLSAGHEFTRTEESLVGRLSDALVTAVAKIWHEMVAIEPSLRGRESNVPFARIGNADEPVTVCRFTVAPPAGRPAVIDIVFPATALRAMEGALAAQGDESCARGAEWRHELDHALGDVRIEARTVLARPSLNLSELMQLKVGDVIPVTIPSLVPLLVEGRTFALGSIGEQDGKAALKIEKIETRRLVA
jgi:flagellar motor switch protein FliM